MKEPAYTPQVEAISPTLPTEDSSNRQFKEELLANISKKDGEISTMETQIAKLKKKVILMYSLCLCLAHLLYMTCGLIFCNRIFHDALLVKLHVLCGRRMYS